MMEKTRYKIFIIVLLSLIIMVLSSCGSELLNNAADDKIAEPNGTGAKKASSIKEYIDQALTWDNLTDKEVRVLKEAKRNGRIALSDYEAIWSDFKTCMSDRGYPKFDLSKYGNIYTMPPLHFTGTEEQWNKYQNDYNDCYGKILAVDSIYRMQWGNPNLYSDRYEAVADCLRRENKVPSSYSASDLRKESEKHTYIFFEEKDAIFRGCKVANGWHNSYDDDTRVDLWEQ